MDDPNEKEIQTVHADDDPNIDPTLERKEIFEEIEKEPVFVSGGEGCVRNIEHCFGDFAEQHQDTLDGIKGKKVLIKINAVDPSRPDACTSPEALRTTIENLLRYEPAEICIGDQPAKQSIEGPDGGINSEELFRRFKEQLGYDFLGEYPTARFIDFRSELEAPEPENIEDVRMYNLSGFETIFSLSLPKAHGQLDFSGCRKNIVGLLPQDERMAILHPEGPMKDWKKNNSSGMKKISETYAVNGPKTVYILDGYKTIMGHEHNGVPRVSDFAIVSMDPFNADLLASTLGFSAELTRRVPYLHDIPITEDFEKIKGDIPDSSEKNFTEHRVVFKGPNSEGTISVYETVIDPEIDEVIVKPIEDILENVDRIDLITEPESMVQTLGHIGSDRAIDCLFKIASLTDNPSLLKTIFYYIHIPVVSSRKLDPQLTDDSPDLNGLASDRIYLNYQNLAGRLQQLGVI
ncbi:MAG: DUF362 domain-containing protein [Candidatus Saccharibacteria bacterium]